MKKSQRNRSIHKGPPRTTITLGIIGGGQLGRLLVLAADKLHIKTIVLDPTPQSPAGQVASEQLIGDFKDPQAIAKLAKKVDFLTFEIESADADILQALEKKGVLISPAPAFLKIVQDKYLQKKLFAAASIPMAPFAPVTNASDITMLAKKWGYPLLLKARRHAYDGRGNFVIKTEQDIDRGLKKLAGELYAEQWVPFTKELATQVGRTQKGRISVFPLVETIQQNSICHIVKAPASVSKKTAQKALRVARNIAKVCQGAGIFGIELFVTKKGDVLLNEIAPRVHNSGHHTIESCTVSQFEQHVRLVTGLAPKAVRQTKPAVMVNILGARTGKAAPKNVEAIKKLGGIAIHLYGKAETKPERKMGHFTVTASKLSEALTKAKKAQRLISI